MKRKVHLAQVNNLYGTNAFLPYSVGMLWAYAAADPAVRDDYDLDGFTFLREPIQAAVAKLPDDLDVLAVSSYIWNSAWTHAYARAVKRRFSDCLVVMGGPHVPVRSNGYFQDHPYLDVLVHYEGEVTFAEVLKERAQSVPDYLKVSGLSVNVGGETVKTPDRPRINDLERLPSPYLAGLFDGMLTDSSYDWNASSETHRGCPYSCAFCDWGSNTMAKLKRFSTDRLVEEYEFIAKRRVEMIYNCDANYGIFDRDTELTERMIKIKERYGYPKKFRAAYAKNSGDRVFQISKMLNDAGMSKGTTLSFQSMDEHTLETIKRKNIAVKDFAGLMNRYRDAGIPTYSEMICGLPGETYDSWADGFQKLLDAAPDCNVNCYSAEVLPNAEMGSPEYRALHGIKSIRTPVLFFHATPDTSLDPETEEHYEIVVATNSLPPADWLRSQLFAWAIQALHCMGGAQKLAVYAKFRHGINYRAFYEGLVEFAQDQPDTVLGRAYEEALGSYSRLRRGEAWGFHDRRFGDVIWPVEEGGALLVASDYDRFLDELTPWLEGLTGSDPHLVDVLTFQRAVLRRPTAPPATITLAGDVVEYLAGCYRDQPPAAMPGPAEYRVVGAVDYASDLERWGRECVWYSRKGGQPFWELEKA